jgi:hypothetical protein
VGQEKEMEKLKEEKKKIVYMLYDLLKASEGNKEKLERICLSSYEGACTLFPSRRHVSRRTYFVV